MLSSEHTLPQQEFPTIAFLPAYDAAASAATGALAAACRLPAAFLPDYSVAIPSRWWEEAAKTLLRTSHDFSLIILILQFIPLSDPTIPASLLSGRQKGWLDAFLNVLCRDKVINVPPCDSLSCTAEAIVAIIHGRPSSLAPQWEGNWIFSAMCDSNMSAVAEKLDIQMHSVFCTITYADWIAWRCGYRRDIISNFLDALLNFRSTLAQYAQEHSIVADKLRLLEKALSSQQPLLKWVITTAVSCDTLSNPADALRFFLEPIAQQFEGPCPNIASVCRRLSILDARFRLKVIHATDPEWPIPFSTDFSVWEDIQGQNPQELAESNTVFVRRLFLRISITDLQSDDGYMKDMARMWSDLSDDFLACLSADQELTTYFMCVAENLIHLGNLFTAATVGLALAKWGYRPRNPSSVWDTINPKDNFAGCRKLMTETAGCLPHLFPYIRELRGSENAPVKILEFYQMIVGYLERTKETKLERTKKVDEETISKEMIGVKYSPFQTYSYSRNPQREPLQNPSGCLCNCKGTKSFAKFQKLPIEIRHLIWEASLPEPRIFDNDTLGLLRPQNGVICLHLIPSMLQLCRESRAFAQSRLRRSILFRLSPLYSKRTIYFDPGCDTYKYYFSDLIWRRGPAPSQCLFSCVEIVANVSPDQLTDTFGYGLRSEEFHFQFPKLKRLIVTDRHTNLLGDVLRNGWSEARWNRESTMSQRKWDREWKSVVAFFERRDISIIAPSALPQTDGRQISGIAHVPDTRRDGYVDTHTNPGLSYKAVPFRVNTHSLASLYHNVSVDFPAVPGETNEATIENESEKQERPANQIHASSIMNVTPPVESTALPSIKIDSQVSPTAVICHGRNSSMLDPDLATESKFPEIQYHIRYRRADGSDVQYIRRFSLYEQSFAESEATEV